jgi:hypothetical protein
MQGASWISLFRRIPANLHDGLMLTLTTGSEVVVQRFVQLESDYAVVCGRMAGTQDNGRIVLLPYNQLVAVNITRKLTETEIESVFGQNAQGFATSLPADGEESAAKAADAKAPQAPDEETPRAPAKPAMPSKTELLQKLRARMKETNKLGS